MLGRPSTWFAYGAILLVHLLAPYQIISSDIQLIICATSVVYIGCVTSLRRTEEKVNHMSQDEAMRFPLTAAAMLVVLFLAFKYFDKYYVNLLLGFYFFLIGVVTLGDSVSSQIEELFLKKRQEKLITVPLLGDLTMSDLIGLVIGVIISGWYLATKHWLGNNLLAVAFCIHIIQQVSVGSFRIGAILLVGLFVYDIIAVFYTPMMVTVAKNVDGPIKMLFIRGLLESGEFDFSLLGLGDIALPGFFVALMIRLDRTISGVGHCDKGWPIATFPKPYFTATLIFYALGLVSTVIVMNVFKHAQPALLYLVPAVLIGAILQSVIRGEVSKLISYDEEALEQSSNEKSDQTSSKFANIEEKSYADAVRDSNVEETKPSAPTSNPSTGTRRRNVRRQG